MKRLFVIVICLLAPLAVSAQSGAWSGKLDVQGTKLSLVFHLDGDNPTMDSPDQGVRGIPVTVEYDSIGKITITIQAISARYEGLRIKNNIYGTFNQMGASLPLTLAMGEDKPKRPQTPVGPFPYSTQEVSFANGDVVLKGTLTLPEGYSRKTPVLLMISGSGAQNRDEELFEHRPFAVIADALAREGFATLRYDDRGTGESTGNFNGSTTYDFKDDALAGVKFLRESFDKVGVVGHSEGGTIALMLSAEAQVDFAVSLAGMVVSGTETLLLQNKIVLAEAGYPQYVIDRYCKAIGEACDAVVNGGMMPQAYGRDLPEDLENNLAGVLYQLQTPYFKDFISLDVRPVLGSITCPILALNGTKDTQVEYVSNLDALRSGLQGNPLDRICPIENANHLFQHCQTGSVSEYRAIEETFAPEAISLIVQWLSTL